MGTIRSLASMSQQHKSLVSLWITALHGNEGIDDDLLRSTGPIGFLGLAATIVEQSLQAWQMGIIDTDNLLGGLSYFTQDLLNFSLPGIIAYLARRQWVRRLIRDSPS
jgi:mediator of RNA polymerase II transcription subunit 5